MKNFLALSFAAFLFAGCHVDSIYTGTVQQAMFEDVRAGNIKSVERFLDAGGNVNTQDEPGCTPLHWAVNDDFKGSHRDMIKLLIDRGANVKAIDDTLTTPLHLASNKEAAELLIRAGADVNATNHEGRTLLFNAANGAAHKHPNTETMYLDLVNALLRNNIDVNIQDVSGATALHAIAGNYDQDKVSKVCDLLIAGGANLNLRDNAGQTALDISIREGRSETVSHLRKRGGETSDKLGDTKGE